VDELEMYTSDRYNSRILEQFVMAKLVKTYGPDKERFLERIRGRRSLADEAIPVDTTISPNEAEERGSAIDSPSAGELGRAS
jgi:hypothetical protein